MTIYIKEEEDDDSHFLQRETESVNLVDYLPLPDIQARIIAKFPVGSRVLHSIVTQAGGTLVCFCTVDSVAIHLPSRRTVYGAQSDITEFPYLEEDELLFAPDTPVWTVLPESENQYLPATVVFAFPRTKETQNDKHQTVYSVVSQLSHQLYDKIDGSLVQYRREGSAPPELAVDALTSTERQPCASKEDTKTKVAVESATSTTEESIETTRKRKADVSTPEVRDTDQLTQTKPDSHLKDTKRSQREEPAKEPSRKVPRNETDGQLFMKPAINAHLSRNPFHSQEVMRQSIFIPMWVDLDRLRARILNEREALRQRLHCNSITLSPDFYSLHGSEPAVEVTGPQEGVAEFTRIFQIMAAELVDDANRTKLMFDFAFANQGYFELSGEYAFNYLPPKYENQRWIAIVPLEVPNPEYYSALYAELIGVHGMGMKELQQRTRCIVIVMRSNWFPHIVVAANTVEKLDDGVRSVKDYVAFTHSRLTSYQWY